MAHLPARRPLDHRVVEARVRRGVADACGCPPSANGPCPTPASSTTSSSVFDGPDERLPSPGILVDAEDPVRTGRGCRVDRRSPRRRPSTVRACLERRFTPDSPSRSRRRARRSSCGRRVSRPASSSRPSGWRRRGSVTAVSRPFSGVSTLLPDHDAHDDVRGQTSLIPDRQPEMDGARAQRSQRYEQEDSGRGDAPSCCRFAFSPPGCCAEVSPLLYSRPRGSVKDRLGCQPANIAAIRSPRRAIGHDSTCTEKY